MKTQSEIKEKAIDLLNKIDFTTKQGQENYKKAFDKFDEYSIKFDKVFEQFDKGLEKFGSKQTKNQF